jgi:DNA repair exonuclease SbcCD ATPase subunit
VSQISEDLRAAEEYNRDQRVLRDRRESLQRQIKDADDEVRRLEDQIQVVLHKKKALFEKLEDVPIPQEPQDTEPFHQKLALAGEINERVELHKRYIAKRKELDALGERKEELDDTLEDLRDERKRLAETAKLPVDGVQWDADGLRVNGRDFETLSASEKIRFSVRIGAASNAELKIMRVMDGSLLDKKSFEELKQIAVETDYQLWVETVGEGHGDSIEITEGVLTGGSNE